MAARGAGAGGAVGAALELLYGAGPMRADAAQRGAARELDRLLGGLGAFAASRLEHREGSRRWEARREKLERRLLRAREGGVGGGLWGRARAALRGPAEEAKARAQAQRELQLWARGEARERAGPPPRPPAAPPGVYIQGPVGSGKTMLMDLFYREARSQVTRPRRVHFNAMMLELHEVVHRAEERQRERQLEERAKRGGWLQHQAKKAFLAARRRLRQTLKRGAGPDGGQREEGLGYSAVIAEAMNEILSRGEAEGASPGGGDISLVCFDELQVPDAFTAVAVMGLFEWFRDKGVVLVATSNRAPAELNDNGFHARYFQDAVARLVTRTRVVSVASEDYRRLQVSEIPPVGGGGQVASVGEGAGAVEGDEEGGEEEKEGEERQLPPGVFYFWPLGLAAERGLRRRLAGHLAWCGLPEAAAASAAAVAGSAAETVVDTMFGRTLSVRSPASGVAEVQFSELCEGNLGPADYCALAQSFHTVCLREVPQLGRERKDQARRFLTLVDELYNHRCVLLCTAATGPDSLFRGGEGEGPAFYDFEGLQFEGAAEDQKLRRDVTRSGGVAPVGQTQESATAISAKMTGQEERFAFQRTVSRLFEMQSPLYRENSAAAARPLEVRRVSASC